MNWQVAGKVPDNLAVLLQQLTDAIVDDLTLLATLHSVELDAKSLTELKTLEFPDNLGLNLYSEKAPAVFHHLREVVSQWPDQVSGKILDLLASDFSAIYLNNGYAASPQESYWLDDEHLVMQKQMFQVRKVYEKYGLTNENWRKRADDHLVNELQFVAYVLDGQRDFDGLHTAARFLDEHLLRWLDDFCGRVAARCETAFYGGLALLTSVYCEELRELLAVILDEPRPSREDIDERMAEPLEIAPVPVKFMPGTKPSW